MKVFLTGATASQVAVGRGPITFMGLLHQALIDGGAEVVWAEPSITMTKEYLSEFDSIVVGLAPPTSTAAHRIYGALSVAHIANDLGTLRILIDAPDPYKVWAGLRAIYKKPSELAKSFYQNRKEYKQSIQNRSHERLFMSVTRLYQNTWPDTIFPSFPWMSFPSVCTEIPMTNSKNLIGLNFDSYILQNSHEVVPIFSDYWVADAINSKWTKGIEKTVSSRIEPVKASRWEKDSDTYTRMRDSMGCLVSTYRKGNPWWSISLAQSLSIGVPVVTDWRLSSMLGEEWSVLAHSVEDMNEYDRASLAFGQREKYLESIPNWDKSVELACTSISRK